MPGSSSLNVSGHAGNFLALQAVVSSETSIGCSLFFSQYPSLFLQLHENVSWLSCGKRCIFIRILTCSDVIQREAQNFQNLKKKIIKTYDGDANKRRLARTAKVFRANTKKKFEK